MDTTMKIIVGVFIGITSLKIINSLLDNFSFSFECSYKKEYEEYEECPPPYELYK